jgi:Tol biopolymer transport system component
MAFYNSYNIVNSIFSILQKDSSNPVESTPASVSNKIVFTCYIDGDAEIFIMNIDVTNQKQITSNSANDGFPCFNVASDKIAFVSNRDVDDEIYIMNTDGSNQQQLTFKQCHRSLPRLVA